MSIYRVFQTDTATSGILNLSIPGFKLHSCFGIFLSVCFPCVMILNMLLIQRKLECKILQAADPYRSVGHDKIAEPCKLGPLTLSCCHHTVTWCFWLIQRKLCPAEVLACIPGMHVVCLHSQMWKPKESIRFRLCFLKVSLKAVFRPQHGDLPHCPSYMGNCFQLLWSLGL